MVNSHTINAAILLFIGVVLFILAKMVIVVFMPWMVVGLLVLTVLVILVIKGVI
jgi:hypothetical protein